MKESWDFKNKEEIYPWMCIWEINRKKKNETGYLENGNKNRGIQSVGFKKNESKPKQTNHLSHSFTGEEKRELSY